jgi:hypothetical protein
MFMSMGHAALDTCEVVGDPVSLTEPPVDGPGNTGVHQVSVPNPFNEGDGRLCHAHPAAGPDLRRPTMIVEMSSALEQCHLLQARTSP